MKSRSITGDGTSIFAAAAGLAGAAAGVGMVETSTRPFAGCAGRESLSRAGALAAAAASEAGLLTGALADDFTGFGSLFGATGAGAAGGGGGASDSESSESESSRGSVSGSGTGSARERDGGLARESAT